LRTKKGLFIIIPLTIMSGIIILSLYYHFSLNFWIHDVNPELEHYSHKLISNGTFVRVPEKKNKQIARIDRILVNEMTKDRIVINLSRSEIRFSPLGRKCYAKVYLETAVPDNIDEKRVRVKFLAIFKRRDGQWRLVTASNLLVQ